MAAYSTYDCCICIYANAYAYMLMMHGLHRTSCAYATCLHINDGI